MNKSYIEILKEKPKVYKDYLRKKKEGYYQEIPKQYTPSDHQKVMKNIAKTVEKGRKKEAKRRSLLILSRKYYKKPLDKKSG